MTTIALTGRLTRRRLPTIPLTVGWGLVLALGTALISGVSVWLNAFAVRQVPDPAVYTTLKNGVAAVILLAALAVVPTVRANAISRGDWARLVAIGVIG